MVTNITPIYAEIDEANRPTNLAVATTDEVIGEAHGGTGTTDFSGTVTTLSTSATGFTLSGTTITVGPSVTTLALSGPSTMQVVAREVKCTELTNHGGSHCTNSLNVSSNVGLNIASVSSIESSAGIGAAFDNLPIPAPLIWLRMEADGATHVSERDFGFNVQVIGVSSVPNYFAWDDSGTNNRLYVSADGVYKVTANCSVISDTTIEVQLNLKINSNLVHYATQMVHTLTDPHSISLTYIGVINKNQAVEVTRTADGAAAIALKKYSTLLIERVG